MARTPRVFLAENIGTLARQSNTVVTLNASTINIASMSYKFSNAITCNTASVGYGGLDTGTVQANRMYYVYAVVNPATKLVALVASLSASAPTGYTDYRFIGYFDTDGSNNIRVASKTITGSLGDVTASMLNEAEFLVENGPGWALADGRSVTGSRYAAYRGTTLVDPRGRALRMRSYSTGVNPDGDMSLGTAQGDQFASHSHSLAGIWGWGNWSYGGNNWAAQIQASSTGGAGGNETRMKNTTVNFYVKIN